MPEPDTAGQEIPLPILNPLRFGVLFKATPFLGPSPMRAPFSANPNAAALAKLVTTAAKPRYRIHTLFHSPASPPPS